LCKFLRKFFLIFLQFFSANCLICIVSVSYEAMLLGAWTAAEVEFVCSYCHIECCYALHGGVGYLVVAEVDAYYGVFVVLLVDYDVAKL